MDDQQLLCAEFRRVFRPQPIADIVRVARIIHHDEQHRLLAQWRQLLAVFLPTLDTRRQIGLIASAGYVRSLLRNPLSDPLERALDHIVDDGLLQRVVVHGPGEELPFAVARRRREIQLRGEPSGDVPVQTADYLIPFAFLVMRMVRFVV